MVNPPPAGSRRPLSGVDPPEDMATTDPAQVVAQVISEALASSADRHVPMPFAFVIFVALELGFVFGLLVCTKLDPSQVLQITAGVTAISVAGFFGRSAIIITGRRLIAGSGKQ